MQIRTVCPTPVTTALIFQTPIRLTLTRTESVMNVTIAPQPQTVQQGEAAITIFRKKYGEIAWITVVVRKIVVNGGNGVILFRVIRILMESVMCATRPQH